MSEYVKVVNYDQKINPMTMEPYVITTLEIHPVSLRQPVSNEEFGKVMHDSLNKAYWQWIDNEHIRRNASWKDQ